MDSVLLYALPLAWLAFRARRRREHIVPLVTAFAAPVVRGCSLRRSTTASRCRTPITRKSPPASRQGCSTRKAWRTFLNSIAHDPDHARVDRIAAVLALRSSGSAPTGRAVGAAVCRLYRLGRRRFHERPLLRDAVPDRRHRAACICFETGTTVGRWRQHWSRTTSWYHSSR